MNENSNPAGNPRVGQPHVGDGQDPVRADESQFGRFESLAGQLIGVPKEELDEKVEAARAAPSTGHR
jgi:hypothetical protein